MASAHNVRVALQIRGTAGVKAALVRAIAPIDDNRPGLFPARRLVAFDRCPHHVLDQLAPSRVPEHRMATIPEGPGLGVSPEPAALARLRA